MQILTIAGTVGKDAVLRQAGTDDVLSFSIAVDNGKDKNGEKRPATWFDCSLWGKRATSLQSHITKGSKLTLTGRPSARAHDGKAYLQLNVNELTFMGGGQRDSNDGGYGDKSGGYDGYGQGGQAMDDSIPFAPECRI